jgi:hypothetical protein
MIDLCKGDEDCNKLFENEKFRHFGTTIADGSYTHQEFENI